MPKKNLKFILTSVLLLMMSFNVFAEQPLLDEETHLPVNQSTTGKFVDIPVSPAVGAQPAESIPKVIPAENPDQQASIESAVFVHKVKGKMNTVYKSLFTKLENNGYYVIFEPNIGRSLAHSAKRWGKDYNKNKLDSIRSIVFCNGWYANKISNEDPTMLALCPLHVTLIHKDEVTSILFVRPGRVSQGSSANSTALEVEQDVIRIIKESVY